MLIIGLTGTNGAGKGAVATRIVEEYGFVHYSVRDLLIEEATRQDLQISRTVLTNLANELRKKNGRGYIAEQIYEKAAVVGKNAIIESIRNEGEIDSLQKLTNGGVGFSLVVVDANYAIRYERITGRNSATDTASLMEFIQQDDLESTSDDPNKQNLQACMGRADFRIYNNRTLEDLRDRVDQIMRVILQ